MQPSLQSPVKRIALCLSSPGDYQLSNVLLPKIKKSWLKGNHLGEGSNILFHFFKIP